MKKIYAHWCYCDNFGDALNPYLLYKLSGCKVIYCNYANPILKNEIKRLFKDIIRLRKPDLNLLIPPRFRKKEKIILAIGSILDRSLPNFHIWGAGYMNKFEKAKGGKLYAVRGPYSAEKLHDEGFPLCNTYGDPALLLPLVYNPLIQKKYECGIIPHLKEYEYFKNRFSTMKIINLRNENIEETINQILSCKYIISTSLHGIIVAHAYDIPALWIKKGNIDTDGIKFKDYFASVGIPIYSGKFDIDELLSKSYDQLPEKLKGLMLPHISISKIQRNLISVCPFEISPMIKERIL